MRARCAFLKAEANFDTDPFQIKNMDAAIDRIRFALDQQQAIAIYGDYDVDGVTATALLLQALQQLNANVRGYIPNQFDEGYGLNNDALDHLKADGVKLVITVDCGIRSPNKAQHARDIGLDLVISDHHHPSDELPPAFAILNPKQAGDLYADKDLAGVGIAYKIAEALIWERRFIAGRFTGSCRTRHGCGPRAVGRRKSPSRPTRLETNPRNKTTRAVLACQYRRDGY